MKGTTRSTRFRPILVSLPAALTCCVLLGPGESISVAAPGQDPRAIARIAKRQGISVEMLRSPEKWARRQQSKSLKRGRDPLAGLPVTKTPKWLLDEVAQVERAQVIHSLTTALADRAAGDQKVSERLSPLGRKLMADLDRSKIVVPPSPSVRSVVLQAPPLVEPPDEKDVSAVAEEPIALQEIVQAGARVPPPVAADTQPTQDAQSLDPLIAAKAQALGKDAIRIYNFVHDTIATEIYFGSKKGAVGTLREGRGNDTDQASLLIALLRAAGVPARYEIGTVELSAAAANTYASSESLSATLTALSSAGIRVKAVSLGSGRGIGVQMAHTWVRAYLPLTAYRGIREGAGQDSWTFLGPALKRVDTQKAVDLRDAVTFDFQGYLAQPTTERPSEAYERQIRSYIQTHGIDCQTVDSATKRQTIAADRLPLLPVDLAARRVTSETICAELPVSLRHMVTLTGTTSQGSTYRYTSSMASLWGKSITVVYEPATSQDAAKIGSYGGIENTPAYAIQLSAVLKVDGVPMARGASEIPGAGQTMRLDLQAPGGPSQSPTHVMTVGGVYAYALDAGLVPADLVAERKTRFENMSGDDREAEKLFAAALSYHHELGKARERIAALHWHRIIKNVEDAQAGVKPLTSSSGGTPVRLSRDVFVFDAPSSLFSSYSVDGDHHRRATVLKLSGFEGSFLEHRIGEEFRGPQQYSAVSLVQQAGPEAVTFSAANVDEVLGGLNLPPEVEEYLRDAAAQGFTITAPTSVREVPGVGTLYGFVGFTDSSGIYKVVFQGAPLNGGVGENGSPPTQTGPQCNSCGGTGPGQSEVNLLSGNYFDRIADLSLPSPGLPLNFLLTYSALLGWHHSYDQRIDRQTGGSLVYTDGQGVHWTFTPSLTSGVWNPPPTKFQKVEAVSGGGYIMSFPDGTSYAFDNQGGLVAERDTNGHEVTILRENGRISAVQGAGASGFTLSYAPAGQLTQVTDTSGRTLKFVYDPSGNLTTYTDVLSHNRSFTYDSSGRMRTKTDFRGNVTHIDYDDLGRVVRMEDPEGGVHKYAYDPRNRRVVYTDRLGNPKLYELGALGLPTRIVDALGNEMLTVYDDRGNRTAERDARGNWSTSVHDDQGNLLSHTDALHQTTSYGYTTFSRLEEVRDTNQKVIAHNTYDQAGNLTEARDALGNITTYTYENGLPSTITRPGDSVTAMTYNAAGNLITITDAGDGITIMDYDPAGHLTSIEDPENHVRTMTVDAKGRMTQIVDPVTGASTFTYDEDGNRLSVDGPGGAHTEFGYDKLGRLTSTTDALGAVTKQSYDPEGRVLSRTDARGFTTRMSYDVLGRLTSTTDPTGATTTAGYCANQATQPCLSVDALGNVSSMTEDPLGRETERKDPLGNTTHTEYSTTGLRASVTDPAGYVTSFGYDDAGRLTRVTDAKQGVTAYGYDERGNRTSVTDANLNTTTFRYDLANRLIRETVPEAIMTTQYTYDLAGNRVGKLDGKNQSTGFVYDPGRRLTDINYASGTPAHFEYDSRGNRSLERNGDSERHMTYDALGRLVHLEDVTAGHSIDYTYDATGNRTSMTVNPEAEVTSYVWDSRGLLLKMTDPDKGVYGFTYDRAGRRTTTTYPNGMVLSVIYDANSRVLAMVYKNKTGKVIESFTYTYDSRGNRTAKIFADGTAEQYEYDELSRLVQATYPNGRTVAYTYDAVGNRTQMVEGAASSTSTACPGDTDCDGVPNAFDNCPSVANPDQRDADRGAISPNLRLGLRFEEPSGTVTQAAGRNATGTLSSDTARAIGKKGNAVRFPGNATANVRVPHSPAVDVTGNALTIAAWIKPEAGSSGSGIVSKGGQYGLWFGSSPGIKLVISGNTFLGQSGVPSEWFGVWTHVAATWNGNTVIYYVNGNQVLTVAMTGTIVSANTPVLMGCNSGREASDGGSCSIYNGFKGSMDEVGVWDRVLSPDEVVALFRGALVDEDGKGDACDPCPNTTDPACVPTTCLDEDGDGYGVPGSSACSAGHPELFDCNDQDPAVHPGAVEACDQIDNNCNGQVDDACIGAPKVTKYHYNRFNQLVKSGVPNTCAANDKDCDGVPDSQDNCPNVYNPGQEDRDGTAATPLVRDALAVWGFEEKSGNVAKDGIDGHDGTILNGATRVAGRYGQGLNLDGIDDRVSISNLNRSASAFSVELWANVSTSGFPTLIDFESAQVEINSSKLNVYPPGSMLGTVPSNQWAHLAVTWDGRTLRQYINGSEAGNTTAGEPGGSSTEMTIGSRRTGRDATKGVMDEVAVFNRALSPSEVLTHSQNRLTGDGLGDACDPCPNNPDPGCGFTTCIDNDGDGYGIQGASNCSAGHPELFDCNDQNANVHPGAVDVPWDGLDNDCNGYVDEPMTGMRVYQWDGNGNLVSDGTTTYTWDARDRLVSNGYGYDTGNLRVKMGTQTVLLDGIEEAREYGTEVKRYDHDPSRVDGLLAQKTGAGKGYFVTDALGSVYAVVDSTGAEVSKYGYDVYGTRTASVEGMATGWGFTGRRHDSGTEMYYRARYREVGSGWWMAADPAGTPEGPNRYLLALANPARYLDPLGLKSLVILGTPLSVYNKALQQGEWERLVTEYLQRRGLDAEVRSVRDAGDLLLAAVEFARRQEVGTFDRLFFFGHGRICHGTASGPFCGSPIGIDEDIAPADFAAFASILEIPRVAIAACGETPGRTQSNPEQVFNMSAASMRFGVKMCYSPRTLKFVFADDKSMIRRIETFPTRGNPAHEFDPNVPEAGAGTEQGVLRCIPE